MYGQKSDSPVEVKVTMLENVIRDSPKVLRLLDGTSSSEVTLQTGNWWAGVLRVRSMRGV